MASEWSLCHWGDLATLEYGRSLRDYQECAGEYPVYGTNGQIGCWTKPLCRHPGVIVGRKGAYRGVHYSDRPFWAIDTAFYVVPKDDIDLRWAYYQLLTQDINSMDSGSAIPSTSRDDFYALPVRLPPLPEQRRIAAILSTFDEKIQLNHRMNRALESIARAVFKSWFVDFDPVRKKMEGGDPGLPPDLAALFPDAFEPSPLGPIPRGWHVSPLGELFRVGIGGVWGEDSPAGPTNIAVRCLRGIDLHELAEGRIPDSPIRYVSAAQLAKRQLERATLLVEGSGSFCGRSLLVLDEISSLYEEPLLYSNFCKRLDAACSPEVAVVGWMQLACRYREGEVASFRTGTAFPNLDMHGLLANLLVIVPPETVARAFRAVFAATRGDTLATEAVTLGLLRDALLPRLLEGSLHAHQ